MRDISKKYTKDCIHPWKTLSVFGDGSVQPCCSWDEGSFGNLNDENINTFFDKNVHYDELKQNLLSGRLPESCIKCRTVPEKLITTDQLKDKVQNHLKENSGFKIEDYIVSITNKCNLRCIYCPQSADKKRLGEKANEAKIKFDHVWTSSYEFYQAKLDKDLFLNTLDYLCKHGLKRLHFIGLGEFFIIKEWKDILNTIFKKYPKLFVAVVTNFSLNKFSDDDIKTLLKLNELKVSCDTLDPALFDEIRVGGNLNNLIHNLKKIYNAKKEANQSSPIMTFNVTESDKIVSSLLDLCKFATQYDMNINISNLFYAQDTVLDKTKSLKKISEIDDDESLKYTWEIINSLFKRMKAENIKCEFDQIGPLYQSLKSKLYNSEKSLSTFYPNKDEGFLHSLYKNNPSIKFENFFNSFDDQIRGALVKVDDLKKYKFEYSQELIDIYAVRNRADNNFNFYKKFSVAFEENKINHLTDNLPKEATHLLLTNHNQNKIWKHFYRNNLYYEDIELVIEKIHTQNHKVYIWCAGERTKTLLDWTALSLCNIKGVIDQKKSGTIYNYRIFKPDDNLEEFDSIIICNATNPHSIEESILKMEKFKSKSLYIL